MQNCANFEKIVQKSAAFLILIFPLSWFLFSLLRAFERRTLQLLLRDSLVSRAALSRGTVSCCFHQRCNFFHHYLMDV